MDNRDTSNEIKPSLIREYEFFGGCIRVKISVKNTSSLAVLDAALELESDERILHFDRCEPEYPEKKGKIVLGNINPNTDRTVAFYLDPLICAKEGTDVNCRVSFKDAFGRPDSVQMEPLKIKVVCPIFRTEQDVNIGRLKELVSGLQFHDSKVYIIPKKLEISELLGTCRNVIQLHDVRHIKTFKTTDEKTYEAWYYGKTKVMKKDLVIKCAICKDTESIEVFASGNDPADITGLLAEIGRNLTKEFERLGKAQPVFNIHIKDSIIQRSNLLSFCNMDGTCGGDVVIEDSVVQRANIASWNEAGEKERGEAQKREREEQESLRRLKEHEERAQRERKAREDAEKRESERLKARQEEERIAKEREELSDIEKKKGFSQIKFLAMILLLGVLVLGYWTMSPYSKSAPETLKSTPTPTPKITAAAIQTSTVPASAATLNVGQGQAYNTIQSAIDAAKTGDIISVAEGTYSENLIVKTNGISIIGKNKEKTIIDGKKTGSVIKIEQANNVKVSGFTIQNSGGSGQSDAGISLYGANNNFIANVILVTNVVGISIYSGSNNNVISGNDLKSSGKYGILIFSSSDNKIYNNNIQNNKIGIYCDSARTNHIYSNNLIDNNDQAYDNSGLNSWDDGKSGNYWSVNKGILGGKNAKDNFPLSKPVTIQ